MTAEGKEQNIRGTLSSGGEPMENFIRTHNWSTTCLGSSEQWPQSLRLTLNLCLSSHLPMAIALGQSLTLIFNDAWKTLFGSPLTPEALGRSGREVWPHLWSVIGAQLENAFAQKQAITQENCRLLIDRQGHQEIYFTYSGVPLLEETGEVSGIFITATETTSSVQQQQRHQVIELPHSSGQEILRQSEERLRLASEVSRLGIWDWDLKRNVLTWNQQCKALFGLANNLPMSYKAFLSALHPDDRELFYTAFRSALRPPGRLEVEYRIIWSNGEVRWLSTFGLATFAGRESCGSDQCSSDQSDSVSSGELDLASTERAGEAIRFTGTFLDITEQKQTNLEYAQLLEREQQYTDRLKRLAEAAVAIHSALSLHERLQLITDQARSIIQAHQCVTSTIADETGAQAIYATSLSDHYQPWQKKDFQPDHTGLYRMICRTQRPIRLTQSELESHPDGDMISQSACYSPIQGWLAAPLTSQNGKNIGLIQLSDKSEGEFTEEDEAILVQLAQMAAAAIDNAHLYEASEQANQIKDDFLAILSHELRSPLNAILGWSKLLQAQQFDKTTTLRALETIERNAQLQTQLIEDLLDVSRILRNKICLQIAPVNPIEPMTAAIETMSLAAEAKAIEIIPRFDPDIGLVPGDSSRLQQIFWNLLSNAIKFTPQGGQVTVELKRSQTHVHIQVSDTGKGISAEFLPYIFDHFRQADASLTRKEGGLGLGLAIVRHLVDLHGGTIQATSPGAGQGTTFTVQLPLSRNLLLQSHQEATSPEAAIDLRRVQILIVDDEPDARDFAVFVLQRHGAQVTSAASAQEALSLFEQIKPDILVTDLGMPETDGYSLLKQIRQLNPNQPTPAIALTAYASEEDRQRSIEAGFTVHIAKPVDPEDLLRAIQHILPCLSAYSDRSHSDKSQDKFP